MARMRSKEEADKMIEEMMNRGNGKYITQSVLFKKDSQRDIELLKYVIENSTSFGAFIKQLIAKELDKNIDNNYINIKDDVVNENINKKDTGNFI